MSRAESGFEEQSRSLTLPKACPGCVFEEEPNEKGLP
jgi:hypothetical protein